MNPEASKPEDSEAWNQPDKRLSVYAAPSATQLPESQPPQSKPSVAKPPESKPSVAKPPVAKPSVSKPLAAKPSVSKAKHSTTKPGASKRSKKASAPQKYAEAPADSVKVHKSRKRAGPGPKAPKKEPESSKAKELAAIQKRAEGRSKVPETFRESVKYFCISPTGLLKILRLILIIAAVVCFVTGKAHVAFIAIAIQEACIVLFFILVYMVTLQHLLNFLHWPLFDLINSFISAGFLLVVAVLTWQEKKRRQLFYIGGIFCLTAAIVCLIDALVVTKKMRSAMKKALRFKVPPSQDKKSQPQPQPKPE